MPITLNHSNIGVQYNTGSNYIIETVKSDLYFRNEIYDTIVRDNIQTAPVIPIVSIQDGSNIYAVESYTYSGSANTADYTRVFPKNTICDILIVGGGGAGGGTLAGGGGGGAILFANNITLGTGSYTIKVGKGGTGVSTTSQNGPNGQNSSITINSVEYIANGGGGGGTRNSNGQGRNGSDGGSGGGGSHSNESAYQGIGGISNKNTYSGWLSYGNNGGKGRPGNSGSPDHASGGGGGAGSVGGDFSNTTGGGNGGTGKEFISTFGTSVGHNGWFGGGGGGSTGFSAGYPGFGNGGNGLLGGGGNGGFDGAFASYNENPAQDGLPNTGGGGGGAKYDGGTTEDLDGGDGGSGIVIIRYLVGTIPTNNLLTEPTVISPVMTESIRTFAHSGGTESQTTHTITVGQNTICDILMIGGGGAGGPNRAGGGGSGALILSIGNILRAGTYTINVGNGGSGYTADFNGVNGFDCEIVNSSGTVIFRAKGGGGGGGIGGTSGLAQSGGSGGGARSQYGGLGGSVLNTNIVNGITSGPVITTTYGVYGNIGGRNFTGYTNTQDDMDGAGGGGIGQGGSTSGSFVQVDSQFVVNNGGKGGDGLYFATINGIVYNFKNDFNVNGIQDGTTGNFFIGGGGGGGDNAGGVAGLGGKGGGGAGGENTLVGNPATGYGSGGGGGGGGSGTLAGGKGSPGIVIIKFKSIVGAGILDGITHKRLNFAYEPRYPSISTDNTNLKAWYKFDGNYNDSSGSGFNLTNSGAVIVDGLIVQSVSTDASDSLQTSSINLAGKTYSISFWAKFNTAPSANAFFFQQGTTGATGVWLSIFYQHSENRLTFSHYGSGNDMITTGYNMSSMIGTSWHHYVATYNNTNRAGEIWFDGVKLNTNISTFANAFSGSGNFIIARSGTDGGTLNGLMEDFRYYDKVLTSTEISQLYNIPTLNTYTLNFPVPTIADINNNSNIVLRGAYDISLSTANAVIIPKAGQHIPKPTTFTNYAVERMYPPVRNFTAATTTVSGQTYGNGTYIVSFSSTLGGGNDPWTCFNTAYDAGGHWADSGSYTDGNYIGSAFIVAGYLGDWLKIQLPVAIKLTKFGFLMRIGNTNRSPKDFKIYGSNDNITWVELVNKTSAVYNASNMYEQTTPEITNSYNYYGLVVNKLFSGGTILNFNEWYIYGQEVLPSSLSVRYNLLNPVLDSIGAQWTYNSSNTNVYHMGSVGIGTKSPEYHLDVRGSIYSSLGGYTQTGLTSWYIASDRRIKENIVKASYEKCLDNVKNIELYNFNFKDNCVNTNDKHQLGFIAQEVQQVYPKAVEVGKMILNTNETIDDLLSLNTTQIDYTLYGAVKNLIEKIEDIDNELGNIERNI
jgi:hypothetical protein